jgi:hypothetical protein
MENLGMPLGLTLFVSMINLPIYVILSMDSHIVRLPLKTTVAAEFSVDLIFAWFIAGSHFNGGASWFWYETDLTRQISGAALYLIATLLLLQSHRRQSH